ncbi:MAG: hypothetical protein KGI54_08260 [Pseudomonadota bacterium]|nr:hypothetical protein [Pseudomonadota bacterium]
MSPKELNLIGIDVLTKDKQAVIEELSKLPSTVDVVDAGEYREYSSYSLIILDTTLTMQELEDWLFSTDGVFYIGTWERDI